MEDVLGYAPKTARDRVRVAIALGKMPALAEALESGEQSYSALRELTRVVTPSTQREWCDAVRGKNLRQIEELVGVHRRGDLPTDPPNPDLAPRRGALPSDLNLEQLVRAALGIARTRMKR